MGRSIVIFAAGETLARYDGARAPNMLFRARSVHLSAHLRRIEFAVSTGDVRFGAALGGIADIKRAPVRMPQFMSTGPSWRRALRDLEPGSRYCSILFN